MRFFKRNREKKNQTVDDIVLFMTAYEVNELKRNFPKIRRKLNRKELLDEFHINGISHDGIYITPESKTKYHAENDNIGFTSSIHFDFDNNESSDAIDESNMANMAYTTLFGQRAKILLDEKIVKVNTCFNMDSFLVSIDSKLYQVDPMAFMMNTSIIVSFEMIHFDTGLTVNSSDIYGRANNLGILPVEKYKYFNEEDFFAVKNGKRIADIIFDNVWGFFEKTINHKWKVEQYSYVHNILVFSNNIKDLEKYFQCVVGAEIENLSLNNIGANSTFKYFMQEYLGVITGIDNDNKGDIIIDGQILEAFKMYIYLQMIIDYDINHDLKKLINHQIFVKSLLYPTHVPIITMNLIGNLKNTVTFPERENAIAFKIESLKLIQERKKNNNGIFLNILLFLLALISSIQTLDILQREAGISFWTGFIIIITVFIVLGAIWIYRELK